MAQTITPENLKEVSQTDLGVLLGITAPAMRNWLKTVQPDEVGPFPEPKKGPHNSSLYNWHHVREWYTRYKAYTHYGKALTQAASSATSLDEARRRKEFANAQLAELELAEAQKRLVPAKEVEQVWCDQVIKIRSKLMALPSRMAVLATDGMSAAEREALYDLEIRSILSDLSSHE